MVKTRSIEVSRRAEQLKRQSLKQDKFELYKWMEGSIHKDHIALEPKKILHFKGKEFMKQTPVFTITDGDVQCVFI